MHVTQEGNIAPSMASRNLVTVSLMISNGAIYCAPVVQGYRHSRAALKLGLPQRHDLFRIRQAFLEIEFHMRSDSALPPSGGRSHSQNKLVAHRPFSLRCNAERWIERSG